MSDTAREAPAKSMRPREGGVMSRWRMIAPVIVWLALFLTPVPAGLNANQWHYFAIFAAVIVGLVLESMPPGAVGLIGLTLAAILGYVDADPARSLRWALPGSPMQRCGSSSARSFSPSATARAAWESASPCSWCARSAAALSVSATLSPSPT